MSLLIKASGAGATAADIDQLAGALSAAEAVATPFDAAIAAAKAQLADASSVAKSASDALGQATGAYNRLESAARKSAVALESAQKGPDLGALTAKADAAALAVKGQMQAVAAAQAAMAAASGDGAAAAQANYQAQIAKLGQLEAAAKRTQNALEKAGQPKDIGALKAKADADKAALLAAASAMDKAKASADAADASVNKLSGGLKTLEGSAKQSAASIASGSAKTAAGMKQTATAASSAIGAVSPLAGRLGAIGTQLSALGPIGYVVAAAIGAIAIASKMASAAWGAFKFALMANAETAKRIDAAFKKAGESTKALFAKVDTGKVAGALETVLHLLDANTSTGRALQNLMATIFNPIMAAVQWLAPYLKELFTGAVVAALNFMTTVYLVRNAILRAIPDEVKAKIKALIASVDGMGIAFTAGKVIFGVVAAVIGGLIAVFGALAAAIAAPVAVIVSIVNGISSFITLCGMGISAIGGLIGSLGGLAGAAISAGADFVSGLVEGITNGISSVVSAVGNLADAAVNAAKAALGIGSPSKVMMVQGGFTGEGMAVGIEQSEPAVRSAVDELVSVASEAPGKTALGGSVGPAMSATNGATTTTTSNKGGNTYQITINAPTGDAGDIKATFIDWLRSELEAQALSLGAGEVPA